MQCSALEFDRCLQLVEGFRPLHRWLQSVVNREAEVQVTYVLVCLELHAKHWEMRHGGFETRYEHVYSSVHSV